jgi:diguanylate cyclase (GGDEF)-like protein
MAELDGRHRHDDVGGDAVALAAARALLRVDSRAEAAAVLRTAVRDLGGTVVDAPSGLTSGLSDDVSLGIGPRALVEPADSSETTRRRLLEQLPPLLADARVAAARCDRYQHQATRARTDALTGLAGRGEVDARLGQAADDEVVCLMDLDGFKSVNDERGHAAGDRALRQFGELLRASVRDGDFVGRYGGDEFLLILAGIPLDVAEQRMQDLVRSWASDGPGVGVSVGVAAVDQRGSLVAVAAADRALYRVKADGGSAVQLAAEDDFEALRDAT